MKWDLDILIITIYLGLTLGIGVYFSHGIKTIKEYSIGQRDFSTSSLVMTITATFISASSLLGGSEQAFKSGISYILVKLGIALGTLFYAYLIGPRMRPFLGLISAGEISGECYGLLGRTVTGFTCWITSIGFVAAQIKAMSIVFNYFIGVEATNAVLISSLIVITYSSLGGIKAVTITDILQFITLVASVPLVYFLSLDVKGGEFALLNELDNDHLSIFHEKSNFLHYFSLFLFFAIPTLNPTMCQRMLMAKDISQITQSFKYSAIIITLIGLLSTAIGLIAYIIEPSAAPDTSYLLLVKSYLPVGIRGIAIIGIIAAAMSTADSHMNVGSVGLVHDTIRPLVKMSSSQELFISRAITLFSGFLAIILAINFPTLYDLVFFMSAFYTPIAGMPLMLGIFGFRSSWKSFLAGMITSIIIVISWWYFDLHLKLGFGNLVPAMLANIIAMMITHYSLGEKGGWGHGTNNDFGRKLHRFFSLLKNSLAKCMLKLCFHKPYQRILVILNNKSV